MRYKYKKGQIFGKRLDVPKDVLERVYRNICTYNDFVKYGLFDKIPSSCMRRPDIDILTKFGNEKCDGLDWELISKAFGGVDVSDILMSLDPETKARKVLWQANSFAIFGLSPILSLDKDKKSHNDINSFNISISSPVLSLFIDKEI